MCGITGVAWFNPRRIPDVCEIRRMIHVLSHRGPDAGGLFHSQHGLLSVIGDTAADQSRTASATTARHDGAADGLNVGSNRSGVMLGHRRLSIIDLDAGRQPLCNEDCSVWVAFNGEIYNYREIRADLLRRGHRFQTESDTEVIVHLYEEYGAECVQHLRGMFAIALWDQSRQRLLLLRDRLGQKPLVWRHTHGRLEFASELKSLLQLDDAERTIDPTAVDLYLTYQYVPHPVSILQGYHKLPPGHLLVYEHGQVDVRRYWQAPFEPDAGGSTSPSLTDAVSRESYAAQCERLRETLTEAVRLRMRSDVPLGAFLSGGIDSTIIAGLMQSCAVEPVHTFSIGFPVARFDERSFAREAAIHLGTTHHEQVVDPSALAILPRLVWHYDEPFSDSSAIPTMALSRMTREFVTVALSGDGGDELFAGYDRYRAVRLGAWFDRLPSPLRRLASSSLWQKLPASVEQKSFRRRLRRFLEALSDEPAVRYLRWISIFDAARRQQLWSDDMRTLLHGHDSADLIRAAFDACPSRDLVTRTTCADVLTYLPCDILNKVDIASMAYGLEARSPFLDHHVAELAAGLPITSRLQGSQSKRILIDTFKDLLPTSIQKRPKMGFGVPLDHWFRDELKPLLYDVLLSPTSLDRSWFRADAVRQLVDEHVTAKWDHSYRLWNLLVFELWQQTWIDAGGVPESPPAS